MSAYAQSAPEEPASAATSHNLDLSSSEQHIAASSVMQSAPQANINVGATVRTVLPTDMLTAAEMVAVRQVLATGNQYLQLNEQGIAVGGGFRLSYYANGLNNLVVPQGVRVSQDAALLQSLNLAGNLTNSGTFNVFSSNAAVTSASVNASNIYNNVNATISSTLANLNLNAINNIVNAGSILSAGNLTMNAGGSITNALPAGLAAMSPIMQAAGNLNLLSSSIVNSGLISSLTGNINVNSVTASSIALNNMSGVMQALNGAINIRDASYTGTHNINLGGGDYLSREMNLYSGHGAIDINVGQLTGKLSSVAEILHLQADTPTLTLGDQCLYGDPTYANTGAINIAGALTITGGPLVIIAGTNILSTSTSASITNNGNDIYLIAGATVNTGSCTGCANNAGTSISGTNPSGTGLMTAGTVTVNFASGSGGNIDFAGLTAGSTASTATTVINSSNATSGDGGNVVLAARANGGTGGQILFATNTISINTSSRAPGNDGGDVTVIAGSTSTSSSSPAVQLGTVITADSGALLGTATSTTSAGSVSIYAAQPTATSGTSVTFTPSGTYNAGSATIVQSGTATTGYLKVATLNTSGSGGSGGGVPGQGSGGGAAGDILMNTAGTVNVTGSLLAFGGGGGGGGNNVGGAGGAGADISLTAGTNNTITISGNINNSGGGGGGGGNNSAAGGAGGAAGTLTMTAPGASGSVEIAGNLSIFSGTAGTAGGSGGKGGDSYGGAGGGGAGNTGQAGSGGGASFGGGGAGGGGSATPAGGGGGGGGGFGGGGGGSSPGATGGRGGTANGGGGGGDGGGNAGGTGGQGSNNGGNGTGSATGAPGGGGAGSGNGGTGGSMSGQANNAGGGGGGNAFNGGGGGGFGTGGGGAGNGGQGGQAAAGGTGGTGTSANGGPGTTGTGTGANYSATHGTINITAGGTVSLFTGTSTQLIRIGAAAPQTNRRNITAAVLGGITAAELIVGSASNAGGITIAGDFNITSDYDLTLSTGGNYTGAGQIITIGARTLTADSVGTMNTGRIVGTNGFIYLTSSGDMTVSDNVTVGTGPGETYLVANSGSNIILQGDVGLGNIASVIAANSITRSGGVVSGGDVILTATNGSVGTSGNPVVINTSVNTGRGLTFNATNGNAYINENDGARIKASQAGNTVVLNVAGNTTITGAVTAGTSLTINTTSGDLTIEADVGTASATTTALTAQSDIFRTAGTVSGLSVNLTATTGTIGTDPAPIVTEAGSGAGQGLTLNATNTTNGFIYVRDLTATRVKASTSGNYFQLRAAGAITVDGVIANGNNDGFLVETTAGNGAITLNANLDSDGGLTVATHGTGNIVIASGVTVSSNNNQMLFTANDMQFDNTGTVIDAGTALIVMQPNGTKSIVVGGTGGTFNIGAVELGKIKAGTLSFGNNSGGVTINGDIDVSVGTPGTTFGAYNLSFTNNNDYSAAGRTITLGARSLTVDVNGTLDTGTVTGTNSAISLTAGTGATVSGDVNGGTGTVSIVTDTSGNINLGANVSTTGGGTTTINARGSILRTTGTVTGTHINLTAVTGSVGQDANNPIFTNGGSNAGQGLALSAVAGSVYVSENSPVRTKASSALNTFSVSVAGSLITEGNISAQTITLQTTSGIPSITLNSNITSTGGPINITTAAAGTITVGTGFDIVSGGGNITLTAHDVGFSGAGTVINAGAGTVFLRANGDKSISVGGGSGTFIISPADLGNIIATTLDISDTGSAGGGITIAGPINVSTGTPGTTAGAYNLNFTNNNNYTGAGQIITLGTRTMSVNVVGTLNTGTITGGVTTITLTSGAAMTVSAPVTVTGSGSVILLTTTNSDITLSANTGGGATTSISADNSIIHTAGVASGNNVNLTAEDGSIGTSAPNAPILTNAGSAGGQGLNIDAKNGSAYISDTGAVRILSSQALSDLFVTSTGAMTVSGQLLGNAINLTTTSGNITISASIGSMGTSVSTLNANGSITRTGGTVFGTNVNLTSQREAIGTDPAPIVTEAGNLATQGLTMNATDSANGFIYVRDLSAVRVQTSTSGNYFQLRSAGSMTVDGVLTNGQNDGFLLETTAANGALNINANIVSAGGATFATQGTGNIIIAAGVSISSNNNQMLFIANDMDFGGSGTIINAGNNALNSNITLRPNGTQAIAIAGAGGVFNISSAELANIRAVNLAFGNNSGGITIAGAVDVSVGTPGTNNGAYNLSFTNNDNFSAAGQTITLGSRTITVDVNGTLDTGTITGGNSSISLTGGTGMTVSGNVTLTTGSVSLITDAGGNIALGGNVGGAISASVNAAGSITRTAGTVIGANVTLIAGAGSIGTGSPDAPIVIDAGALVGQGVTLTANNGSAYVTDINDVIVKTSTTGAALVVKAAGSITTSGTLTNGGGGNFTLETTANNGAINVNNNLVSTGVTLLATHGTGNIVVLAGADITASNQSITLRANDVDFGGVGTLIGAGGNAVFLQANGNKSIVVNGAGGTFNVSSAELANITATTLNINDNGNGGGLTIAGPLNVSTGTPGTTPGAYNLNFGNAGSYTAAGQTITLGTRTLTVTAGGTATTGSVTGGSNSTITITGGTGLTVSGNLIVTGASSSITLATTAGGNIDLAANIDSNQTVIITADGSVTRSAGTITGTNIDLNSNTGSVGTNVNRIVIDTGTTGGTGLKVVANTGSVYVTEVGAGRTRGTSTVGDEFVIGSGGSYTLNGTITADNMTVNAGIAGSDITVSGNVTGTTSVLLEAAGSILRTSGTLTGLSVTLSVLNGNIGVDTASGVIVTEAGTGVGQGLTLTALSGAVFVRDLSAVAVQASTSQGTFRVRANGTITVSGQVESTNANVTLETTVGSSSINVNANVLADQVLNIITSGTGDMTVAAGVLMRSDTDNIAILAHDVSFGGSGTSLQASSGAVDLRPNNPGTISVGGTGGSFSVTAADLANIKAQTVRIDDNVTLSNMTITGSFNLQAGTPGTTAGAYDLFLVTAGTYSGSGQTITLNGHDLTVSANSTISTGGILSTNSTISFTGGSVLTITGNVVNTNGITSFFSGNNGNVSIAGNVTGATTTTLNANGSGRILRSGNMLVSGDNLNLTSGTGDIGQPATPILVSVDNLSTSTTGHVYVVNDKDLTLNPTTIGGTLFVTALGTLTTGGNISAENIVFTTFNFDNANTVTATGVAGTIGVTSTLSQGLTVTGGGTLVAPGGVFIVAAGEELLFEGNQNITGNGFITSIGTNGSVTADLGTAIFSSGDLAVTALTVINNTSAFTAGGTVTFTIVTPPAPTPTPTPSNTVTETTTNFLGDLLSSVGTTNNISTRNDPVIIPTDQNQGNAGNSLSTALSTDLNDSLSTIQLTKEGSDEEAANKVANLGTLSQNPPNSNHNYPQPSGPVVSTGEVDLTPFTDLVKGAHISQLPAKEIYKKVAYSSGGSLTSLNSPPSPWQSFGETIRVGEARSNIIVFTAPNQVTSGFIADNTETTLTGTAGTVVTRDKNLVVMHTGRLLTDNGKQPVTIFTNQAAITIGIDAAAVVEVHPGAPVRVMSLAGQAPITVRTRDGEKLALAPGQQVVIGQTQLSDADLLPTGFSLAEFMAHDSLFNNNARLQGHISLAAKQQAPTAKQTFNRNQVKGQPACILAERNTEFSLKELGQLQIYKGTVFVHASDELVINTPLGQVHDTKGKVVGVTANGGKARIQVLSGPRPVSLVSGKNIISLKYGKELFIADHKPSQSESVPADGVGRRGMSAFPMDGGLSAVISDFSIMTLLNGTPYLNSLRHPVTAKEQFANDQIIKAAAIVHQALGSRGRYYSAPKETASATLPDWVYKAQANTIDDLP